MNPLKYFFSSPRLTWIFPVFLLAIIWSISRVPNLHAMSETDVFHIAPSEELYSDSKIILLSLTSGAFVEYQLPQSDVILTSESEIVPLRLIAYRKLPKMLAAFALLEMEKPLSVGEKYHLRIRTPKNDPSAPLKQMPYTSEHNGIRTAVSGHAPIPICRSFEMSTGINREQYDRVSVEILADCSDAWGILIDVLDINRGIVHWDAKQFRSNLNSAHTGIDHGTLKPGTEYILRLTPIGHQIGTSIERRFTSPDPGFFRGHWDRTRARVRDWLFYHFRL